MEKKIQKENLFYFYKRCQHKFYIVNSFKINPNKRYEKSQIRLQITFCNRYFWIQFSENHPEYSELGFHELRSPTCENFKPKRLLFYRNLFCVHIHLYHHPSSIILPKQLPRAAGPLGREVKLKQKVKNKPTY